MPTAATLLGPEAAEVAELYKIPAAPSRLAGDENAAVAAASFWLPVVMKIASPDIMHKTDVGGVKVGLKTKEEVVEAFKAIMESSKKAAPDAKIYGVEVQENAQGRRYHRYGYGPDVRRYRLRFRRNLVNSCRMLRLARGPSGPEIEEMITETKAYIPPYGIYGLPPTISLPWSSYRASLALQDFLRYLVST